VSGWRRLSGHEFHATVVAARGVALVMLGSSDCGVCRAAHARAPDLSAGLVDVFFELDAGEAGAVTREYGTFHLPDFFLFRDGVFHARYSAPLEAQAWRAALAAALAAPAQEEP
jgi:hypothetical protein